MKQPARLGSGGKWRLIMRVECDHVDLTVDLDYDPGGMVMNYLREDIVSFMASFPSRLS